MLAFAALPFAWAGGQSEKSTSQASGTGQPIELTYMTRFRAEEFGRKAWDDLAQRYSAKNPNVKITFIDITYQQMRQQTLLRAQAGNPPDITEPVVSWIPTFAGAGILEPVSNYFTKSELDNYFSASIEDATIDGVTYAIPFWNGPILLFGNKELLKKVGFTGTDLGDIQQFRTLVEKIGKLGNDSHGQQIVGFALRDDKSANTALWFVPWLWQYGGSLVDDSGNPALDSDGMKKALEFYQWMTKNGYAAKGMDPYKTRTLFAQGDAGFVFDGPWLNSMLRTITKGSEVDSMYQVFPMPKGINGKQLTIAKPTDLVVLKGSKHKKEAFDFVKFATSDATTLKGLWEDQGLLPAVKSLGNAPYLQTPYGQLFVSQINNSKGVPWKNEQWPGVQDILAKAITEAVTGGNVDDLAKSAQSDFRQLMNK